jgi:hypothetical protein
LIALGETPAVAATDRAEADANPCSEICWAAARIRRSVRRSSSPGSSLCDAFGVKVAEGGRTTILHSPQGRRLAQARYRETLTFMGMQHNIRSKVTGRA